MEKDDLQKMWDKIKLNSFYYPTGSNYFFMVDDINVNEISEKGKKGLMEIKLREDENKMDVKQIPKIGKTYNCFDDGKISHSRLYTVDVKDVIPFDEIDKETLENWKLEVEQCYWLYAKETDYFIKTENGEDGDAIFVRTKNGGWFSMGDFMNSGILDVDGKLTEMLNKKMS